VRKRLVPRIAAFASRRFPWFLAACIATGAFRFGVGCSGWDPSRPFERNSPDVDRALAMLDAGDLDNAEEVLSDYLGTGVCNAGEIGLPETVRERPDGSFDMSLVLFYLGERYGRRFGDEEKKDPAKPDDPSLDEKRDHEIRCALLVALAIASDGNVPIELRARAYYLAGNLEFLRANYPDAIKAYEQSLKLVPGIPEDAGNEDGIGRDAAWNRAVAIRRLENQDGGPDSGPDADDEDQQPDAGPDAEPQQPDGGQDGGDGGDAGDAGDSGPDGGDAGDSGADAGDAGDSGADGGDAGGDGGDAGDAGADGGDGGDAGKDAGQDGGASQDPSQNDPNQDPSDGDPDDPQSPQQGDRILDRFEESPSYQQEEAKRQSEKGRRRGMEDK